MRLTTTTSKCTSEIHADSNYSALGLLLGRVRDKSRLSFLMPFV